MVSCRQTTCKTICLFSFRNDGSVIPYAGSLIPNSGLFFPHLHPSHVFKGFERFPGNRLPGAARFQEPERPRSTCDPRVSGLWLDFSPGPRPGSRPADRVLRPKMRTSRICRTATPNRPFPGGSPCPQTVPDLPLRSGACPHFQVLWKQISRVRKQITTTPPAGATHIWVRASAFPQICFLALLLHFQVME